MRTEKTTIQAFWNLQGSNLQIIYKGLGSSLGIFIEDL